MAARQHRAVAIVAELNAAVKLKLLTSVTPRPGGSRALPQRRPYRDRLEYCRAGDSPPTITRKNALFAGSMAVAGYGQLLKRARVPRDALWRAYLSLTNPNLALIC